MKKITKTIHVVWEDISEQPGTLVNWENLFQHSSCYREKLQKCF